jgi:hypothetical protein
MSHQKRRITRCELRNKETEITEIGHRRRYSADGTEWHPIRWQRDE